jgi:sterol desaturase/sphingolipid hydroxylase (fatty acid hydroxylase superfamily)
MRRTEQLKASPPMFQSRLLDRFTRVHPAVPVLIYGPVVALMLALSVVRDGWWDMAGLVLLGYALWTLFEYWLHRIVFHFEPEDGLGARLHWMIHGVHHDHPNDPLRLVMPPAASVPLAIVVVGVMFLVAGRVHALGVAAGFLIGYLIYDEIHYMLHHHTPKTRLGRRLRELHMRHHFQDDEKGFGISAPYWDFVFRTYPGRHGETG